VRSGLELNFHTPNALHVKEIDLETACLMRAAGFRTLRLGLERIESGSGDRQDAKVAGGEFEAAMGCLRKAGFTSREVGAYLLAGLPGQPLESLRPSIAAVKRWGATPIPTFYSPIPGTALWEAALASSRYDLAGDPLFCNNAILPCRKTPFDWSEISALKSLCAF